MYFYFQTNIPFMRAFFLFIILSLFMAWALIARKHYVCEIKQLCGNNAPIEEVKKDIRPKTLTLKDGTTTVLSSYEQFSFDKDAIQANINSNNEKFLDEAAKYLSANKDKNISITGFYRPSEKGKAAGIYEDLGTARAHEVEKLLIERGIADERIFLESDSTTNEQLIEPMVFRLFNIQEDEQKPEEYSFTNMVYSDINFEYNSDVFNPGDAFKFYADSVRQYLDAYPDKELTIIGHADNRGGIKYNDKLGMRRAKNVSDYFVEMGITKKRIKVMSMGERKPIVPNDSEANKRKNRRVNFRLE